MAKQGWILVAEDNEQDARQVVELLQQANVGTRILIARNGAQALNCVRREGSYALRPAGDPVFVLLKRRLPIYDGVSVLRTIKEDLNMMHVPVIMYAPTVLQEHLEAAYVWGVNAYIVKPRKRADIAQLFTCVGQFWGISNVHPGTLRKARTR
jgi:CheY-like chemotaxis protein